MDEMESGAAHEHAPACRVLRRVVPGAARADRRSRRRGRSPLRRSARDRRTGGARRAGLSYAVQSLFVARERRELDGLVELLDALADEHPNQPGFLTTAAWARIETGRFDEARVQFDVIGADGFTSILRNGVWLPNMRLLSEIACALETPGPAARIYELMLPYRDRYIVTSRVLSFLGSVEHSLGALSITTGDLDRADAHLAQARANHVGLDAPAARGPHRSRDRRAPRGARRCGRRAGAPRPGCTRTASRTAGSTWPPTRLRAPSDANAARGFGSNWCSLPWRDAPPGHAARRRRARDRRGGDLRARRPRRPQLGRRRARVAAGRRHPAGRAARAGRMEAGQALDVRAHGRRSAALALVPRPAIRCRIPRSMRRAGRSATATACRSAASG